MALEEKVQEIIEKYKVYKSDGLQIKEMFDLAQTAMTELVYLAQELFSIDDNTGKVTWVMEMFIKVYKAIKPNLIPYVPQTIEAMVIIPILRSLIPWLINGILFKAKKDPAFVALKGALPSSNIA